MATHSSILAWRIPWTEEPDRLQSIESHRLHMATHGLIHYGYSPWSHIDYTWPHIVSYTMATVHGAGHDRSYLAHWA